MSPSTEKILDTVNYAHAGLPGHDEDSHRPVRATGRERVKRAARTQCMSTLSAATAAARETFRRADGRFGEQHRHEPDLDLGGCVPLDGEAHERLGAVRPDRVILFRPDASDELSAAEINDLLAGREQAVYDSVYHRYGDALADGIDDQVRYWCDEAGIDPDSLTDTDEDDLRNQVQQVDDSDIVADLVHGTGPKLMRAPLANGAELSRGGSLYAGGWGQDTSILDARREQVAGVLASHGVDVDHPGAREAIRSMVEQGPEYWGPEVSLDVIWCSDVEAAAPSSVPGSSTRLSFADTHVVLLDPVSGDGMDARIPGRIDVELGETGPDGVDPSRAPRLDARTDGLYGWDAAAGVSHGAYTPGKVSTVRYLGADRARASAETMLSTVRPGTADRAVIGAGIAPGATREQRRAAAREALGAPGLSPTVRRSLVQGAAPSAPIGQVEETVTWFDLAAARHGRPPATLGEAWDDTATGHLDALMAGGR